MENNENRTTLFYKISISIIFGILGFAINFYTIKFPFPPYIAVVLIGLLFPMLITLSWGWKYGLLAALSGGCQTMWFLWGPSNGYAIFFVVPPFTLWIMWHGFFAQLRKRQKEPAWWLDKYIIEIPFRLFSTINLLTLSRWAITLNPPPWTWALDAPNTIPMHFSNFIVIKQAAVGYIILLLSDVLLNIGFVRRFFRLKEIDNRTNTGYVISAFLLIGALFWLADSILGSLVFVTGKTFFELFALNIPSYNIFVRTAVILLCLAGGLFAAKLLQKQRESDIALRESEIKYRTLVEHLPAITYTAAFDESSTTLYVSPQIEKIIGISPHDYKADPDLWLKHLHDGDRERVLKEVSHAHETGQPFVSEYRITSTDGRVVWLRDEAVIAKDDKGNPRYLQGVMVDITRQKQTEDALKKAHDDLDIKVKERTAELQKTINLMAGREVRMAELKEVIRKLREQVDSAGMTPVANDPLKET